MLPSWSTPRSCTEYLSSSCFQWTGHFQRLTGYSLTLPNRLGPWPGLFVLPRRDETFSVDALDDLRMEQPRKFKSIILQINSRASGDQPRTRPHFIFWQSCPHRLSVQDCPLINIHHGYIVERIDLETAPEPPRSPIRHQQQRIHAKPR